MGMAANHVLAHAATCMVGLDCLLIRPAVGAAWVEPPVIFLGMGNGDDKLHL